MTYTARFKVTEVTEGKIRAAASVEDGTLTQNTEKVTGMELICTVEDGHETQLKVGDEISGQGHFSG